MWFLSNLYTKDAEASIIMFRLLVLYRVDIILSKALVFFVIYGIKLFQHVFIAFMDTHSPVQIENVGLPRESDVTAP